MLAASISQDLIIQVSRAMNKPQDLFFPGIYDSGIVLLLKDKVNSKDPVGYAGLIAAVIAQAGKDAARGDQEAAAWLAGDMCFDYCYVLGYEHENVLNWLKCWKLTK